MAQEKAELEKDNVKVPDPSSASSPMVEKPLHQTLLGLFAAQERLKNEKPLEKAGTMANKLIAMSTDPAVKSSAEYELEKITAKFKVYIKMVDRHLAMLQKNPNIAPETLPKLPEFPVFSAKFLEDYYTVTRGQQTVVHDAICAICHDEIMTNDKSAIKCERCTKSIHEKCAAPLLQQSVMCPTCKQRMLLFSEYPKYSRKK